MKIFGFVSALAATSFTLADNFVTTLNYQVVESGDFNPDTIGPEIQEIHCAAVVGVSLAPDANYTWIQVTEDICGCGLDCFQNISSDDGQGVWNAVKNSGNCSQYNSKLVFQTAYINSGSPTALISYQQNNGDKKEFVLNKTKEESAILSDKDSCLGSKIVEVVVSAGAGTVIVGSLISCGIYAYRHHRAQQKMNGDALLDKTRDQKQDCRKKCCC